MVILHFLHVPTLVKVQNVKPQTVRRKGKMREREGKREKARTKQGERREKKRGGGRDTGKRREG